jgi:hypothetical protein
MTIGTFVLLGTGLGVGVTPWLLIVPAFMGAGLLYAGVSGTCALASVIARLPWNRRIREETAASAAAGGSSSCAPATPAGCAAPGKPQS